MTEKLANINEVLSSLQKKLKVPKDKKNNFGNFQYRNAEGILEAYKNEIANEIYPKDLILVHRFKINPFGTRIFAECISTLELADGSKKEADGFAEIDVSKKGMDQAQLSGSVMSYAKKYALCNLFAIDDSKDDPDGFEGGESAKPKEEKAPIKRLATVLDGDTRAMQAAENEKQFKAIKALVEACKNTKELRALWESNAKVVAAMKKNVPNLYKLLLDSKDGMKLKFTTND